MAAECPASPVPEECIELGPPQQFEQPTTTTTTAAPRPPTHDDLPVTGGDMLGLAAFGSLVLCAGVVITRISRRPGR